MSQATTSNTNGKIATAVVVCFFIGIVWSLLQFLLSEGIYRLSDLAYPTNEALGDKLTQISDTIAWPAGIIYDQKSSEKVEASYQRALEDTTVPPSTKDELKSVVEEYDGDFKDFDLHDELVTLLIDNPNYEGMDTLTTVLEYSIYVGVCVVWGLAIGILGFLISLIVILNTKEEGL